MDWDSPTTKKHIKEAQAQGCNLLGVGRNKDYRLYGLPCGHEQELQPVKVRSGTIRCRSCMEEEERQEAEAQDCEIVSDGKSGYRIYRLPCGHEQEIRISHMRIGNFRCRVCLDEKLVMEAKELGFELLGLGRSVPYRRYRLPCGHEQEMQPGNLTTKVQCSVCFEERLKQEAKAQGSKIVGTGKNANYRLYKLACGHEQEVRADGMRKGSFRCPVCLANRFRQEAEARGCEILGAGKNANYRRYKLPCGHERELYVGAMRKGTFRCEVCFDDKLTREAKAQECECLGAGKDHNHRLYKLPCGHEQEVSTANMRRGEFACKTCLVEKYTREAKAQGCELIGVGKSKGYRLYKLPCGHEKEVFPQKMLEGSFRCEVCFDEKLRQEAEAQGCKLLGEGKKSSFRLYELPCGHRKEMEPANVRTDYGFACDICQTEKIKQEAEARGCELLGEGRNANYRLYKLPCGHEREVKMDAMRLGTFVCQTCEDTSRTLPSNLYLLHIKVDSDEWLKLGYAKSVDVRIMQYGLVEGSQVTTVESLPFSTGNEANAAEAEIHKRYKRKRLPPKYMKHFHTRSGADECYPVTMLDTLLAELEAIKSKQAN